jgi:hypothetical protein
LLIIYFLDHYRSQQRELKFETEQSDRRRNEEEIDTAQKLARRETDASVEAA